MSGFQKIPRDVLESDLWLEEPFTRGQAIVDLIALANWQDRQWSTASRTITILRGSFVTSQVKLAVRWRRSRDWVQKLLKTASKRGIIAAHFSSETRQNCGRKYLTITILNYDEIGEGANAVAAEERQKNGRNAAKERQKNGTTEELRIKNEDLNTPLPPTGGGGEPPAKKPPKKKSPKIRSVEEVAWEYPPRWGDKAQGAFAKWITYRAARGDPLTEITLRELISHYATDPQLFVASVDYTVLKGWQGLQEPKSAKVGQQAAGRRSTAQNVEDGLKLYEELWGDGKETDSRTAGDGGSDVFDVTDIDSGH